MNLCCCCWLTLTVAPFLSTALTLTYGSLFPFLSAASRLRASRTISRTLYAPGPLLLLIRTGGMQESEDPLAELRLGEIGQVF